MDASWSLRVFDEETTNCPPVFVPRLTDSHGDVPSSASPLFQAIVAAQQGLLARQREDGSWQSDAPGDVTLSSHMILLWACLGRLPSEDSACVAAQIAASQLDDGGWATSASRSLDLDASVLAYAALKLAGYDASTEPLQRARRAIRQAGGVDRTGALVRTVLALLGQIDYDAAPALSPQLVMRLSSMGLLDGRVQSLLIPLSIVHSTQPRARVDAEFTVRELFIDHPHDWPAASWSLPQLQTNHSDRIRAVAKRFKQRFTRTTADRKVELAPAKRWLHARLASGDALGGGLTRMVWGILALRATGTTEDAPEICFLLKQIERLRVEGPDGIGYLQAAARTGETARVIAALELSGLGDDIPAVRRGRQWLFAQTMSNGDESQPTETRSHCWTSDPASTVEADLSVTANIVSSCRAVPTTSGSIGSHKLPPGLRLVADAQDEVETSAEPQIDRQSQRRTVLQAREWLCQMQHADGRWTTSRPSSHTEQTVEPQGTDITGMVLEALAARGLRCGEETADRAVDYLSRTQGADGSWADANGTPAVSNTWQSLLGLAAVGAKLEGLAVRGGLNWLLSRQRTDGSWDACCQEEGQENSSSKNRCVSTAGVILACVAAGKADHLAVARGIEFLIGAQLEDGSWPEVAGEQDAPTSLSLPLLALSRYAASASMPGEQFDNCEPPPLKLFVGESAIA